MMMKKTKTLLVDGDVLLYQCTTAVEEVFDWGDDLWSLVSDSRVAKQLLDGWVYRIKDKLEASHVVFSVSGDTNWRTDVLPTYKNHRKKTRKPLAFLPLKDYMKETYQTHCFHNLEGDDVLGLLAGGYKRIKGPKIIVTIDKDLRTIPGLHFNPMKEEEGVVRVDEEEANYNHLYQALMGDRVDGYFGCPGIGPKTAAKVLTSPTWEAVVEAYEKAGLTEDDALVQARVARILRYGEYDVTNKKVRLWNPTKQAPKKNSSPTVGAK